MGGVESSILLVLSSSSYLSSVNSNVSQRNSWQNKGKKGAPFTQSISNYVVSFWAWRSNRFFFFVMAWLAQSRTTQSPGKGGSARQRHRTMTLASLQEWLSFVFPQLFLQQFSYLLKIELNARLLCPVLWVPLPHFSSLVVLFVLEDIST